VYGAFRFTAPGLQSLRGRPLNEFAVASAHGTLTSLCLVRARDLTAQQWALIARCSRLSELLLNGALIPMEAAWSLPKSLPGLARLSMALLESRESRALLSHLLTGLPRLESFAVRLVTRDHEEDATAAAADSKSATDGATQSAAESKGETKDDSQDCCPSAAVAAIADRSGCRTL
jgi:hypothetical protein